MSEQIKIIEYRGIYVELNWEKQTVKFLKWPGKAPIVPISFVNHILHRFKDLSPKGKDHSR